MNTLFLIFLFLGHYIGDFTHYSTPSMLAAKRFGKPMLPILYHAATHTLILASITFTLSLNFETIKIIYCLLFMLVSHFLIDVCKGRLNYKYKILQDPAKYPHWYVFGLDQFLHAVVLILIYNFLIN